MRIVSFQLSATEIVGQADAAGEYVVATVTLDQPAPSTGVPVLIGSSDPELKVPRRVVVAPGQTSRSFNIGSGSLRPLEEYQVWAQVQETVFRQRLKLRLPGLASVSFDPDVVDGGEVVRLTVTLDQPAPSTGALVLLREVLNYQGEATPLLTDLPPSLFIASGSSSNFCDVTTRDWDGGREPPPRQVNTAVDAVYAAVSKRAILTVTDP